MRGLLIILAFSSLARAGPDQQAIPIPSIAVPSVAVKSVPLADAPLRRSLAAWDRRWTAACAAAGDAIHLAPRRYSPLWFQKEALSRRIAQSGWTQAAEAAWTAYYQALAAASQRAHPSTQTPVKSVNTVHPLQ